MTPTFRPLTLQEGLRIAISIERRNAQLYQSLSAIFGDCAPRASPLPAVFQELAAASLQKTINLTAYHHTRFGSTNVANLRDFSADENEGDDSVFIAFSVPEGCSRHRSRSHLAFQIALASAVDTLQVYVELCQLSHDHSMSAFYFDFIAAEQELVEWLECEFHRNQWPIPATELERHIIANSN